MKGAEDFSQRALMAMAGLLALVIFLPALGGDFTIWDDPLYVTGNERIQILGFSGWVRIWSPRDALLGKFIEFFPLRDSIYALLWWLAPKTAWPFHLTQILLHALATALVIPWTRALGLGPRGALSAALIFAVHPVHVESVAWIAGLKDPLFFVCFAAAAITFLRREEGRHFYLLSLLFLVAGFLSKSFLLAFVPVAFLADVFLRKAPLNKTVRDLIPHLLITLLFVGLIMAIGRANSVMKEPLGGSLINAMAFGSWCFWQYLGLLILPLQQNTFYLMEPITQLSDWRAWLSILLLAGVGISLALSKRAEVNRARFIFAALFFSLLPVLHIIQLAVFMADRYLYLASFFFVFALGWAVERLAPKVGWGLVVAVVLLFGAKTTLRIPVWENSLSIFTDALDQPGGHQSTVVLYQLGTAHYLEGRPEKAEAYFAQVIEAAKVEKGNPIRLYNAHHFSGWIALQRGDLKSVGFHLAALDEKGADPALARNLRAAFFEKVGDEKQAFGEYQALRSAGKLRKDQWLNYLQLGAQVGEEARVKSGILEVLKAHPDLCPPIAKGAAAPFLPGPCPSPSDARP